MNVRLGAAAIAVAAAFPFHLPSAFAQEKVADTVVVTATRQAQRENEVLASVEVIEREQIERAGQSTIIELLATQPGVQISSNGGAGASSSVFIRGTSSKHALLLIDGMRVGSATSGQPMLEALPLGVIERIEILRGPASALYGSDAVGGVIQVFTRKGREGFHPELFVGYGSNDTVRASASLAGGKDRLRYNLTVGQDETDGFNAKRDPAHWVSAWTGASSFNPDDDGFRNRYLSASAALGFREADEIGVSTYYSDGRNWYDTNDFYDSRLDKTLSSASIHMRNRLSDTWTSTLRLGQSQDETKDKADFAPATRFETTQQQFVWQNDVRLGDGLLLAAYEYTREEVEGTTGTSVTSTPCCWAGAAASAPTACSSTRATTTTRSSATRPPACSATATSCRRRGACAAASAPPSRRRASTTSTGRAAATRRSSPRWRSTASSPSAGTTGCTRWM